MTTEPERRRTLSEDDATALGEAILPLTTLVATAGMSHEVPSEAASWEASRPLFAAVESIGNRWVAEAQAEFAGRVSALSDELWKSSNEGITLLTITDANRMVCKLLSKDEWLAHHANTAEYDDNRTEGGDA